MVIGVEKISFSYNGFRVLSNISIEVRAGELVCLLGGNGSGKTTFLKCLLGLLKPQTGAIYLNGRDLKGFKRKELARLLGYVAQNGENQAHSMSVMDALLLGRIPHSEGRLRKTDLEKAYEVARMLGLEGYLCRKIGELSGGELQKVMIAIALVQEPQVLLLDEPTNHLDLKNQVEILGKMKEFVAKRGMTAIVVLHDLNLALNVADSLVFLRQGRVLAQCPPHLVNEELLHEVYEVKVKIVRSEGLVVVCPPLNDSSL